MEMSPLELICHAYLFNEYKLRQKPVSVWAVKVRKIEGWAPHFPKNMQTCCYTGQQKRPDSKAVFTRQTVFQIERKPGVNITLTNSAWTSFNFFSRRNWREKTGKEHITEESYLVLVYSKPRKPWLDNTVRKEGWSALFEPTVQGS